jgi:hypothetical protein
MKKQNTLMTFTLGLLLSINSFAAEGLYLGAKDKEYPLVNSVKSVSDTQYRIYVATTDGRRHERIVNKEEVSLATEQPVNGFQEGRRAIVLNTLITGYDHCKISNVFENGYVATYCDLFIEKVLHRRNYLTSSENMIPEINGPVEGINVDDAMILTKATGIIQAGAKVRVRAFYKGGKALVVGYLNAFQKHFAEGRLEYNAESSVVNVSDLQHLGTPAVEPQPQASE